MLIWIFFYTIIYLPINFNIMEKILPGKQENLWEFELILLTNNFIEKTVDGMLSLN